MSRAGQVTNSHRYPYANPAKYRGGPPRFYVVRADVVGDPSRTRTFWWERPDPAQPYNLRANIRFEPSRRGVAIDDCLYVPFPLHSLPSLPELVVWGEGEKDADAARRTYGVPATTHHRGALAATFEQAAAFAPFATAKGRRAGSTVLVVADRDDAGFAGALARRDLLRVVGLEQRQVRVVRPPDGVLAGGGGCGERVVCECAQPCPPPSQQWRGADLADHVSAGLRLRDLVRVPLRELRAAAERTAEQTSNGWRYAADE